MHGDNPTFYNQTVMAFLQRRSRLEIVVREPSTIRNWLDTMQGATVRGMVATLHADLTQRGGVMIQTMTRGNESRSARLRFLLRGVAISMWAGLAWQTHVAWQGHSSVCSPAASR